MQKAIIRLLEKTNNIPRSIYIWNAINAIVLAMQTPVVMAVCNRTNGEIDAGIFSIAMAEANLMYFVGQFGLRRYQSSDIQEDFKFCEYHAMRLITCALMTLRIRKKGSAGSHNGLENIILHLGTQDFIRIRVGVGDKPEGWDLADHVLAKITGPEKCAIEEAERTAAKAAAAIITDGVDKAMNRYNTAKERRNV